MTIAPSKAAIDRGMSWLGLFKRVQPSPLQMPLNWFCDIERLSFMVWIFLLILCAWINLFRVYSVFCGLVDAGTALNEGYVSTYCSTVLIPLIFHLIPQVFISRRQVFDLVIKLCPDHWTFTCETSNTGLFMIPQEPCWQFAYQSVTTQGCEKSLMTINYPSPWPMATLSAYSLSTVPILLKDETTLECSTPKLFWICSDRIWLLHCVGKPQNCSQTEVFIPQQGVLLWRCSLTSLLSRHFPYHGPVYHRVVEGIKCGPFICHIVCCWWQLLLLILLQVVSILL